MTTQPTKNHCPKLGKTHSFKNFEYWNKENHPTCEACGFIDKSRVILQLNKQEKKLRG